MTGPPAGVGPGDPGTGRARLRGDRRALRDFSPELYRVGTAIAGALPGGVIRRGAEAIGRAIALAGALPGAPAPVADRRRVVAHHLRRVSGHDLPPGRLRRLVDDTFASYARYWGESLQLPRLDPAAVTARITYEGREAIDRARAAGRGAIVALPHLGGWEWAGTDMVLSGYPMHVVVERLQPPELFEWFVRFREHLGMQVIPSGPRAAAECRRALAGNGVLCLLCDRLVEGGAGVEVEFFGERTALPAGPVTLALRSGAPIIPAAVYFEGGGHRAVVRPPLDLRRSGRFRDDVRDGTQALAEELETLIRRAPTQWHLMQPNWPSDPRRPRNG